MTVPALPEELLRLSLSCLSQNHLYHAALASKTFLAIVKPLLYSCVIIKAKSQIEQLKLAKEMDKIGIESVHISGDAMAARGVHFDDLVDMFTDQSVKALDDTKEGCVQELFGGAVLPLNRQPTFL